MEKAEYFLYADWNRDGDYGDANEDLSAYIVNQSLFWEYGIDSDSERSKFGLLRATLDNSDSRFSSFNTASPLYGLILPGVPVKLTMKIGAGSEVTQFVAFLATIIPQPGPTVPTSTAELVAYGPLSRISKAKASLAMQTNKTTGQLLDLVLDAVDSGIARAIDATCLSTISRFWITRERSALEIANELQDAECGTLRENKLGQIAFESRAHRAAHSVSATFGSGGLYLWNPKQEDPARGIYNHVEAEVHTFNKSEDSLLAVISDVRNGLGGTPPVVPAKVGGVDGTLTVTIPFPTPSSPSNFLAIDTWGIVDVEVNTSSDGTGTDITNSSITLARSEYADRIEVTFTNSNASAGHVIVLRAHGTAIVEGDPIPVSAFNQTSQDKYDKQAYPNPSQWLTDLAEGQDYCNHIIAVSKDPRPKLTFELRANYDADHLAQAQARDISDKIHIDASVANYGLGLDGDFYIEYIRHTVNAARLHVVQYECRAATPHSWPASGAAYTPKVIPGASGGLAKVPDDLWTLGIVNGPLITFGGGAWKWNTNIDLGEFRALFCDSDDDRGYADLRTPAEGGTLVHDGATMFNVTGLAADWSGCQYSIDSPSQGRWYFAFRLHNSSGWSVWSDGNDTPSRVTDCRDTQPVDQQSDGPPEDWTITWKAAPTGHAIISSATRPLIHGANIWGVVAQIKQKSAGSWIAIDDASVTLYDGSAVAHALSNNGKRLTHAAGGFGAASVGDLILFDVRGGAFDQAYCQWGTISNYEGWNGTPATATVSATATWIEVQGKFRAWPITVLTDLRIKVVTPPWAWTMTGYFGAEANRGLWGKWYIDPITGLEGDSTSATFESDPIDVPVSVSLDDIEVRYWFDNSYSRNDDNNYGSGATSSGLCIVLADTNPILTDAALDDGAPSKQFRVEVAGDRTLANPTNAICGQILRWCIINSTSSEITITLGDAFRVGKIIPELERMHDKSEDTEFLPGRITEDDAYDPTKAVVYFGNADEDGSFRIIREGSSPPSGELLVQVRIGGSWATVHTFGSSP